MHSDEMKKIETCIYAFRNGDTTAFDTLFAMYMPMIESALVKFAQGSDDRDARSLANEAFHSAVLHWSSEGAASFGTYAKLCVVNALKKLALSRSREITLSDVDVDRLCSSVGLEANMIRRETVARIRETVKPLLSEEEYRVFLSCILGSSSVMEYASAVGKTRKQVENTKARVVKKLKCIPELFSVLDP